MFNGSTVSILLFIANALLGLVLLLIGLVLKMHASGDAQRFDRQDKEIDSMRKRLHDLTGIAGRIDARQRYADEDREKKGEG